MRVLVVAAADVAEKIVPELLERGYAVERAGGLDEARAALGRSRADLVILDGAAFGGGAALGALAAWPEAEGAALVLLRGGDPRAALGGDVQSLHDAFAHHPLPTWIFDERTLELLDANHAAVRAYGWSRDEFLRMSLRDLEAEPGAAAPDATRAVHRRKDGSQLDVELVTQPLTFRGRRARIAAARDITAHLQMAEAQRRSLADHYAFLERSADGVFTHRADGTVAYANAAFVELLGYASPDAITNRSVYDLLHEEDRAVVAERIRSILETRQPSRPRPMRFLHRDGGVRWAETRGILVTYEREPAITVIARDLTERSQADEALRLSEERFSKIFHANPAGISVTRLSDNVFLDVNDRFLTMTGFRRQEVIGRTGLSLGMWQDPESRARFDQAIRAGRPVRDVEARLITKSGAPIELELSLEVFSVGGEPCVFAMAHDITERKRLEEQLRRSQKMEAIGRLAGGVAHDFNNILTAIRGYGELLLDRLELDAPARNAAEHICRSAGRAASLTEQLLVFSRRQPHQPRVVVLNDVVRSIATLIRRTIGEDIELDLDLEPALGRVRVDPGQIEQVILNLAINARDAMADGGRLTVETANSDGDAGVDSARVRLSVRDTGCGMSEEVRLRIFEPFFTTKEVGKGTGLGLSIVYGVVEQSGGAITVETAPGRGTSFHISLPRVDRPEVEPPAAAPAPRQPSRGHELILLVEDDEDVRDFVQLVLESAGYRVLTACNGADALGVARAHGGEIQLLLSDVVMPQMNGRQLAEQLGPQRPTMKVLYMSGYPGDSIARYGDVFAGPAFLQKPFSADALTGKVRAILDG